MRAITPEKEDPETGRWSWTVTTETNDDHETTTETYDAVMICTGHHSMPNIPEFEGAADFAGDMLHSHEYKDNARFAGKKVVTVGIGNSSSDITTEISKVAESTHCVCRSGAWIQLNGHGDAENLAAGEQIWGDGKPFVMSRMEILRQGWSGEPSSSLEIQDGLAANQEWVDELGLKPIMRVGQAHPTQTLNNPDNNLLKQLKEGKITIKRGLERITEHGVVFSGSDEEVPADSIVFCTGWIFGFEFVDKVVWPEKCGPAGEWQKDNENTLYKFMCAFQAWPSAFGPRPAPYMYRAEPPPFGLFRPDDCVQQHRLVRALPAAAQPVPRVRDPEPPRHRDVHGTPRAPAAEPAARRHPRETGAHARAVQRQPAPHHDGERVRA